MRRGLIIATLPGWKVNEDGTRVSTVCRQERTLDIGWKRHCCNTQTSDLNNQKLEKYVLIRKGHISTYYHPQLNPMERVWAQAKRYTQTHCNYSIHSLRRNIPAAFDSITDNNISNHFRKVIHFIFRYLEGLVPGKDLYQRLKKYIIENRWPRPLF